MLASGDERKVWSHPALRQKRVKSFAVFFTHWGVIFNRWVKISACWGKWFEQWVTLHVEVKEKLAIILFCVLISLRSYHNTNYDAIWYDLWWHIAWQLQFWQITHKFIVLNFQFYWHCLSLKANFQKTIFVETHLLKVS